MKVFNNISRPRAEAGGPSSNLSSLKTMTALLVKINKPGLVWNYKTGSVDSPLCLSRDGRTIFVGSREGNVYALKYSTKEQAAEEIKKEAKKSASDNKIAKTDDTVMIKGNSFVTIGGITVPVNTRYRKCS